MPKVKLDHAFCLAATCQPGKLKTDYWNIGDPIGLVFEKRSSGGATFYLRYQDGSGKQRQIKLGGFPEISVEQARKAARRLRSEVVLGGDPLAAKTEKRAVPVYVLLAEQHIAHAKTYQRSWWSVAGIITKHLLPRFGRMRLNEITPQEVAKWLAEKADEGLKPATVEKIRAVFGRSFELARQWSIPGGDRNPVRGLPRRKFSNARNRYLTAAEAARLLRAAERSGQPQLKPIIQLLLLTGARKSELLQAEWQHVDLDRRSWLVPMSKTGKARHVPLSQAAIEVIHSLPRLPGCPYLLPNLETGLPFRDIKRAWDTARVDACMADVRIHDLRHSAASFMINAKIDLFTVGRILGHADHQSTMRYSHLANDTLLAAVEAGAAGMGGSTPQR
ncbi:site-specific integrase [Sphingomonas sp.]|uniref:tyrosine-type recombinase/integrase n=1 Tax=Sphingomonas sp. TaxID=28214 RepID=UPI00183EC3B9|nr:site-specific integrase [Sphingomonas sp.]MBA3511243.1 tyrosine-type recombinase/integrase [Sphingomonas sp.]